MSEPDDIPESNTDATPAEASEPTVADAGRAAAVLALTGATLLARAFESQTQNRFAQGRAAELDAMVARLRAGLDDEPEENPAKALDDVIETLEIAVGGLRLAVAGAAGLGEPVSPWAAGAASLWSAALAADRAARERCVEVADAGFVERRESAVGVLRAAADRCFEELRARMEAAT